MTLTTEQLRARAKLWREKAVEAKWESVSIAQDMLQNADAFDELAANREAQPVGYIDPDSLKEYRGQRAGGTWSAVQRTTSGLNMTTPIYTAPPAPAVNASPDFEAWFVEKYKQPERLVKNEDGTYKFSGVQMAFSAWNACRAAMLTAVPEGGNDHDTRR